LSDPDLEIVDDSVISDSQQFINQSLNKYKKEIGKDESYMLISNVGGRRKYGIKKGNQNRVWRDYCELVANASKTEHISFLESPHKKNSIVIDMTLKFPLTEDYPITENFFTHIIWASQTVIRDLFLRRNQEDNNISLAILRRSELWHHDQQTHVQVMVHFPFCRADVKSQREVIDRCIQSFITLGLEKYLTIQPTNSIIDSVDKGVVSEPRLLYGGVREKHMMRCEYVGIFKYIRKPETMKLKNAKVKLESTFRLDEIDDTILSPDAKTREFYLPYILSSCFWSEVCTIIAPESPELIIAGETEAEDDFINETSISLCNKFLNWISNDRYQVDTDWRNIGCAIHKTYKGRVEGLSLWIDRTTRAIMKRDLPYFMKKEYDNISDTCEFLYTTFDTLPITYKTLAFYAKEDSPADYTAWSNARVDYWCKESISGTHAAIAKVIYYTYWLDFVCANLTKKVWYEFDDSRWKERDRGNTLIQHIKDDIPKKYQELKHRLREEKNKCTNDDKKKDYEDAIKGCNNNITYLAHKGFIENIRDMAAYDFYEDDFYRKLNSQSSIVGLNGGVFEVSDVDIRYRKGKPEDYISKYTLTRYHPEYTWNSRLVKEVMNWIRQIFVDDQESIHSYLKFAASVLHAGNIDKKFFVWYGPKGNNCKTSLAYLWEITLGAYCVKSPLSMFTEKKRNPSSASPEEYRLKGALLQIVEEPDDDEQLRKGKVKKDTGKDSNYCRTLNQEGEDVQQTHKTVMQGNVIPGISRPDPATKNRFFITLFKGVWSSDAPEDPKEQFKTGTFKLKNNFDSRIRLFGSAWLWIIREYNQYYVKEGLTQSSTGEKCTNEYWDRNDIFNIFTGACVEEAIGEDGERDMEASVTVDQVHELFSKWYVKKYPKRRCVDQQVLEKELEDRWGNTYQNSWYGICLRDIEDIGVPILSDQDKKAIKPAVIKTDIKQKIKSIKVPDILNKIYST
jgi:phage/plasmid-associated DNA primase